MQSRDVSVARAATIFGLVTALAFVAPGCGIPKLVADSAVLVAKTTVDVAGSAVGLLTDGLDMGGPIKVTHQEINGEYVDVFLDENGTLWYLDNSRGRVEIAKEVSRNTKRFGFSKVGGNYRDTFTSPDGCHWYISDYGTQVYLTRPTESNQIEDQRKRKTAEPAAAPQTTPATPSRPAAVPPPPPVTPKAPPLIGLLCPSLCRAVA